MYNLLTSYFSINQMTNPIDPKLDFINCNIEKKKILSTIANKVLRVIYVFFLKCYIYNIINIHSYVIYLNIIIIISSVNFFFFVCYFIIFQLFLMNFYYYYYWIVIFCPFFVFFLYCQYQNYQEILFEIQLTFLFFIYFKFFHIQIYNFF